MIEERLAARSFTAADQILFAELSGDWNPMHMSDAIARRTQAGEAVVHGVHALLWSLNVLTGQRPEPIASIRAQFLKFIYVDHAVELRLTKQDANGIEAILVADGLITTRLSIGLGAEGPTGTNPYLDLPNTDIGREALPLAITDMPGRQGWLAPVTQGDAIAATFPALCRGLGIGRVAALARMSALVGMICPGLHSIFSSLSARIIAPGEERPGFGWEARQADARYARITLDAVGSGLAAEAMTFVRPAPVETPPIDTLAGLVIADEFAGRQALIIGGSRGLGAATAKLLTAGGAQVALTYQRGLAEAEAVCADIRARRGAAAATILPCDIDQPFSPELREHLSSATHIYYFATSLIGRQSAVPFAPERLNAFNRIFVERFHDLVLAAADGRPLNIFCPSTVFIEERPKGMTEYAMSKAAAELLCHDMAKSMPGLAISSPRLPRVLTDQTAATIPVRTADAAEVMLPLLRLERPA